MVPVLTTIPSHSETYMALLGIHNTTSHGSIFGISN